MCSVWVAAVQQQTDVTCGARAAEREGKWKGGTNLGGGDGSGALEGVWASTAPPADRGMEGGECGIKTTAGKFWFVVEVQ